jgi:carboxyl-terminal processing protease
VARIKGPEGSTVKLGVKRQGRGEVKAFTLTRRHIEIPQTSRKMETAGDAKVGYVRLFSFAELAARDVRRDVTALAKQGAEAYIFDLRYNPGGLLNQAVEVSNVFMQGLVTTTKGYNSPSESFAAEGPVATSKPLVLLVNRYSASASEIVTGALKDSGRATVVGTRTFGKGLVQSIVDLSGGQRSETHDRRVLHARRHGHQQEGHRAGHRREGRSEDEEGRCPAARAVVHRRAAVGGHGEVAPR